jgi:hypothetical protein
MDHIEEKLVSHLYRIHCPPPTELGEYQLKMLPDDRMRLIHAHLNGCPHCSQELAQLESYLTDLAPELEYSLRERVQIWVAKLIPDNPDTSFSTAARPALALRGELENGPLMYEADGYQLHLEIQADPTKPGYKSILGLLLGGDDSIFEAQLWQNGRSLQQTTIDELGNFVFVGIQPGTYDLILSQRTAEIHVQAFEI